MTRPHALLRVGVTYEKTLGMRRLTNTPVDLAIGKDGDLHILSRSDELTFIRRLSYNDDDLGAVNLVGGGGQVGGTSKTDGHFVWPAALLMDGDETLWISDEATCKISNITTEGKVICQWGEQGDAHGQLNRPSGIAFDSNDDIFIADTLNHRIQKFTRDGSFISTFGSHGTEKGEFDMPWGIAIDELDDIYVEIQRIEENIEADPQQLEEVNTKLQLLYSLQKKHNVLEINELLQVQEELAEKVSKTENLEAEIKERQLKLLKQEEELDALATKIHQQREKSIPALKTHLENVLSEVGMPNAQFKLDLVATDKYFVNGKDELHFLFSANKGGSFNELKKRFLKNYKKMIILRM